MTDHELFEKMLFALEWNLPVIEDHGEKEQLRLQHKSIIALRERLAQPEQEPVAEVKPKMTGGNVGIATVIHEIYSPHRERLQPSDKLYAIPPQRPWVGLTDEEIKSLPSWWPSYNDQRVLLVLIRDAEAKLKEKNT